MRRRKLLVVLAGVAVVGTVRKWRLPLALAP
jgi:hypothetical protein